MCFIFLGFQGIVLIKKLYCFVCSLQKYFKIEDLRNDVAYVEEYIQKAKLPLAFVHTDVHRNNIIVDKSTGEYPNLLFISNMTY